MPTFAMSLSFKILMVLALCAGTAIVTAKFTHDYVATEYQNIALTEKVAVVTREKTIAVADTQAISKATAVFRERLKEKQKVEDSLREIIKGHETSGAVWCELNPDELRVWNAENAGNFADSEDVIRNRKELPNTGTSDKR